MVPTRDFSGLTSSACALARAAGMLPIDSLERCTTTLRLEQIKADSARFRALGTYAVADRFFGVLRHQRFQLGLRALMVQKGLPGAAEQTGEFRPRIRSTHIDDPDRLDSWLGRLDTKQARGLTVLDASPELPLGSDNQVLVKRISMGGDLDPFAAAGDYGEDSAPGRDHPHIVLQLRHVLGPNRRHERFEFLGGICQLI